MFFVRLPWISLPKYRIVLKLLQKYMNGNAYQFNNLEQFATSRMKIEQVFSRNLLHKRDKL